MTDVSYPVLFLTVDPYLEDLYFGGGTDSYLKDLYDKNLIWVELEKEND